MSTELESLDPAETEVMPRSYPGARVVERAEHSISRRSVPENVLKVLYRLHRSGYQGYLCGGSVRDLLMARQPKDFDIATDAHPMEIRRLFRNSRIIGRRFRLVHVLFQGGIVEVSTFRREPERVVVEGTENLLVTDDNTFGTPMQDARRRDFTINGLFYNIADFTLIDYVGGLEDLNDRLIRVIGDPNLRFREDPVRMLRAVEFASRLDFEIEAATYDGIIRHRNEILKASPARVAEEILELLRRGWSFDAFELLVETRLLEPLLPELFAMLHRDEAEYFWKMLEVLDRSVGAGRPVSDIVFLAVLLLPFTFAHIRKEEASRDARLRTGEALMFIRELVEPVCQRMVLPAGMRHQLEQTIEGLWRLLDPPADRRAMWRYVTREQFGDAFALFELYSLSSGEHVSTYRHWQQFVQKVRREEIDVPPPPKPRRRRRRRGPPPA